MIKRAQETPSPKRRFQKFSVLGEATLILIVGLGNPGPTYKKNRHNIGFMVVDKIAECYGFPSFKLKDKVLCSEGRIQGKKVILVKPMDYMNRSGKALGPLARFHKVEPKDVIVIHDDMDMAPGKVKVKQGGGAGGHNGIRDIDAHYGKDTWRLKIGVGHPGHRERVTGHVLSDFGSADQDWLKGVLAAISCEIGSLLQGAREDFLTIVSQRLQEDFEQKG